MGKKDIAVLAEFSVSGKVIPKEIIWEDGRHFSIDYISDIRRAASLKAGGVGMRYICTIRSKEVIMYKDEDKWFMEVD